jgi:hypothetical protein
MPLIAPKPECLNLEFPVNAHERPSRASNPLSISLATSRKGSARSWSDFHDVSPEAAVRFGRNWQLQTNHTYLQ